MLPWQETVYQFLLHQPDQMADWQLFPVLGHVINMFGSVKNWARTSSGPDRRITENSMTTRFCLQTPGSWSGPGSGSLARDLDLDLDLYLILDLDLKLHPDLDVVLDLRLCLGLNLSLDLHLDLDLDLDLDLGLGLGLDLSLDLHQDLDLPLDFHLDLDLGLDLVLSLGLGPDLHLDLEHRPGCGGGGGWNVMLWAGQSYALIGPSSQSGRALCADPRAAVPASSLTTTT